MRRALTLGRGDATVFLTEPISGVFVGITVLLLAQGVLAWRKSRDGFPLVPPVALETEEPRRV